MDYQIASNASLGTPCVLYRFMSHIEGSAPFLWLPLSAFGFSPTLTFPQPSSACPPPIDSIRDITGTEKLSRKPATFK